MPVSPFAIRIPYILYFTLHTNQSTGNGPNIELETPLHNVLFAHLSEDRKLSISFLVKKKNKKGRLTLLHVGGPVKHNEREDTADFVRALMKAAYRGMSELLIG